MRRIIAITILLIGSFSLSAQIDNDKAAKIQWIKIQDVESNLEEQPRFVFIDLYTDWCGWCKRMDATTFQDTAIVSVMNKYYYAVKFDAEFRDSLLFKETVFTNEYIGKNHRPPHQLAISLLDGQMSYPSFAILDKKLNRLTLLKGFQTVDALQKTLVFVGKELYKEMSWEEYLSSLQTSTQ